MTESFLIDLTTHRNLASGAAATAPRPTLSAGQTTSGPGRQERGPFDARRLDPEQVLDLLFDRTTIGGLTDHATDRMAVARIRRRQPSGLAAALRGIGHPAPELSPPGTQSVDDPPPPPPAGQAVPGGDILVGAAS